jgi:hypothetical protein
MGMQGRNPYIKERNIKDKKNENKKGQAHIYTEV